MRALRLAMVLVCLCAAGASAGENIFPDPGFENSGVVCGAHAGKKAGYLKVTERRHWIPLTRNLKVEPFATYRCTAFAKAKIESGAAVVCSGWAWNSFDWRFDCGTAIKTTPEWKQFETTFVCPYDEYNFYPIVLSGAANAEAWVDDVTVEKIKSPEETMRAIAGKKEYTDGDRQLLARWYHAQGQTDKIEPLAKGADDYTAADVYCLLAQNTSDPQKKLAYARKMVELGGLTYANGTTRVQELLKGCGDAERRQFYEWAAGARPGTATAAVAARELAKMRHATWKDAGTFTEQRAILQFISDDLEAAKADCAGKDRWSERARAEIDKFLPTVREELATLDATMGSFGRCSIKIDGHEVEPATYAVVIPANAPTYNVYAANELRKYLEKITGKAIPLTRDDVDFTGKMIIVGKSSKLRGLGVEIDFDDLGEEGIVIKTVDGNLVLAGGLRGALYSVYTFLERYLDCGWFIPGPLGEVTPREGTFEIGGIDVKEKPSFRWRALSSIRDAEWCVKNKIDPTIAGCKHGIDRGDPAEFANYCHIWDRLVPPSKYFLSHPEYYALVKGERCWDHGQLCTSNPEVVRIVAEAMIEMMDEHPECRIFSCCQDDGYGWCECEKCKALDVAEKDMGDRLVKFLNDVGKIVKKKHPDKYIYTLAYAAAANVSTRFKPDDNVIMQLCHLRRPCCHVHSIATCPENEEYKTRVEGWAKICDRLYVYDYRVDYNNYLMPYPNCYAIMKDVPYYKRNNVRGLFYQGGGGALNHGLCHYLLSKLMWNCETDPETVVTAFHDKYYGKAGAAMERYFRLIHNRVRDENIHLCLYSLPPKELFTREFFEKAEACFDEATKLAESDLIRDRIDLERLTLYWVKLTVLRDAQPPKLIFDGKTLTVKREGGESWRKDLARFVAIAKQNKVTQIRENAGRTGKYIEGFVESVLGMRVHGESEFRYVSGAEAHGGRRAIYIRGNVPGYHRGWSTRYSIPVLPKTTYKLSGWIKVENAKDARVRCLNVYGAAQCNAGEITDTTEWKQLEVTFTTAESGRSSVGIAPAQLWNEGEVWVDDLKLVKDGDPEKNWITNGDFERSRGQEPSHWVCPYRRDFSWTEFPPMKDFLADPMGFEIESAVAEGQHKVVTLENELIRVDIIPSLGGRIYRLFDKEANVNHTFTPDELRSQGDWLNYGGYEEYASKDFAGPGWCEAYSCKVEEAEGEQRAVLNANLGKLLITRTVTIAGGSREVRIETTLKNLSAEPTQAFLRVHPIFAVGGGAKGDELLVPGADGATQRIPLDGGAKEASFRGAAIAKGVWAVVDPAKNVALVNRFDPASINMCYAFKDMGRSYNLELWPKPKTLKSGESMTVAHRYVLSNDAKGLKLGE